MEGKRGKRRSKRTNLLRGDGERLKDDVWSELRVLSLDDLEGDEKNHG